MLTSSTSWLHDPGTEELANLLGLTGIFCCRLICFWVVATTIADDARAMPTIAARVLQDIDDSAAAAAAFSYVVAASSSLMPAADPVESAAQQWCTGPVWTADSAGVD